MAIITDWELARDLDYLIALLIRLVCIARTEGEAHNYLEKLEILAKHPKSPATAKSMYGFAYLLADKPWYDFTKGFEWLRKGAEEAQENEPFCWHLLGFIYLCGKTPELPRDLISAKYWIEKAADVGYEDAIKIRDEQWGKKKPTGFKEWLN